MRKKLFPLIKRMLRSYSFWLAMILIFGFLVRLYKIDNPVADWHSWRQADTASVSRIYHQEGINLLYPKYYDISSIQSGIFNPQGLRMVEFPIFNVLHVGLVKLAPFIPFDMAGRLISVVFSTVSIYLLFLLGRRFISSLGGIFAAFFFAFLPFNIYFSRVILPEPLAVMFVLFSLWFFARYTDAESKRFLFLSGAFFALAMLLKPFVIFFMAPILYLAAKKHGFKNLYTQPKVLISALVFLNICLQPFFAWRVWINQFPAGIPFFNWMMNADGIRFRPAFWRWIFGERLGILILGVWGIIPFVFGFLQINKNKMFIHTMLLGMFLYLAVFAAGNVRHDYYQIMIIPAVALALAQGAVFLIKSKTFKKSATIPLLCFSIIMMLGMSLYRVKDFYQINHPEVIRAGEAVDRLTPKNALVAAPYNGDTAFLYHTKRRGWPAVDSSLARLIKRGATYYASVNFSDPDTITLMSLYETVEKTDEYIIIDLQKPINEE